VKIKRSKLRKIIREFVDSYRPKDTSTEDMSSTSAYDQLTNSERAAFVSAMGIAETAAGQVNESNLSEGTVTQFPADRVRNTHLESEDEDPVGQVYRIQPYGTDLEGDTSETDPEDLTSDEISMLQQILNNRSSIRSSIRRSTRAAEDTLDTMDDDFESYLQGLESDRGNLVDLFDEEN
tara:strand:- start:886 stop:1422 length:537 start_codon:yes stop_codon:yes gene_type:complete